MSVAVVEILWHPQGVWYERMRKETNWMICKEVPKMKMEWLAKKKGNVSFLDTDGILDHDRYERDGLHFNHDGNQKLGW